MEAIWIRMMTVSTKITLRIVTDRPTAIATDLAEMLQNVTSDQGLPCFPWSSSLVDTSAGSKMDIQT